MWKKYIIAICPYCGILFIDYIKIKKDCIAKIICPLCEMEIEIG